jgi:hypothetical protein
MISRSLLLITILLCHLAVAKETKNCRIDIKSTFKNGKVTEQSFFLETKDKNSCQKSAEVYKNNFAPHEIKEKKVSIQWLGDKK